MNDDESATEAIARRAAALLRDEPYDSLPLERLLAQIATHQLADVPEPSKSRFLTFPVMLAIAASLLIGIGIGHQWSAPTPSTIGALEVHASASGDPRQVEFVFSAPNAHDVALVGDFNDWNPHLTPMRRSANDGAWIASLALPPGRHVYSFVVNDSTWVTDPHAPMAPESWYGTRSSVVVVADMREP